MREEWSEWRCTKSRQDARNFNSSELSESRFFERDVLGSPGGSDPKPCHRGFIIPERLEAARRPLRDRISIERFAVPSGGGRDECRRMCRPQGRRNLIHCPPYPAFLSRSLLRKNPPPAVLFLSLALSPSLPHHSLSAVVIYLCVLPISFTLDGTPLFLCRLVVAAARFQLIAGNRSG
jgi:hypothetical protein